MAHCEGFSKPHPPNWSQKEVELFVLITIFHAILAIYHFQNDCYVFTSKSRISIGNLSPNFFQVFFNDLLCIYSKIKDFNRQPVF